MGYIRERGLPYKPGQKTPYKVSRSKIELFTQCPRCFWLDTRLKIKRPDGPPFNINKAIDELFKKEFDVHRAAGTKHHLQEKFHIDAVPFAHKDMDKWRHNFTGISTLHAPTNLHIFGAVDDVWVDSEGKLVVVDYKATAKKEPVTALGEEGTWYDGYRRQMEIYQWLLRSNGFKVSDTGYFVYATASMNDDDFNNKLSFTTNVFPHKGSSDWVEPAIIKMKEVMDGDMPAVGKAAMGGECEFCAYAKARTQLTLEHVRSRSSAKQ